MSQSSTNKASSTNLAKSKNNNKKAPARPKQHDPVAIGASLEKLEQELRKLELWGGEAGTPGASLIATLATKFRLPTFPG